MKSEPLVSILMNCYNGERYLTEAIGSVLSQTYRNWEIVFWDNQSTDRSAEIFLSYADSRLKYFRADAHTMLYEARNRAIAKSGGEFLGFLDVDDWWAREKLDRQIALFSDPEVGIVYGNYWIESERKNKRWKAMTAPAPTGWVTDELLENYFVGLPTLMVRRAALSGLSQPCNPRYHVMGDYDLVLRLSVNWKLDCVQEPVAHYRLHGSNETAKHRGRLIEEMEHWLEDVKGVEEIATSPSFPAVKTQLAYQKGIYQAMQGNRRTGFSLARAMRWGRWKLRLLVALMLPRSIVRRIQN